MHNVHSVESVLSGQYGVCVRVFVCVGCALGCHPPLNL